MVDPSRASMLAHVAELAGARRATGARELETLWSGYGEIVRVELEGGDRTSVVVKRVRPPARALGAPADEERGRARKRRSHGASRARTRTCASRTVSETAKRACTYGTSSSRDGCLRSPTRSEETHTPRETRRQQRCRELGGASDAVSSSGDRRRRARPPTSGRGWRAKGWRAPATLCGFGARAFDRSRSA